MKIPTRYRSSLQDTAGNPVDHYNALEAPAKLLTVFGRNLNSDGFLLLFIDDAGVQPGSTPIFPPVPVDADAYFSIELGTHGIDVDSLIIWKSSTAPTLTATGTQDLEVIVVTEG